jgi:pyruvate dehydrogenase (quinone)
MARGGAPSQHFLDVQVDPEVPTLPPHITLAQARNFMSSVLSDPNAPRMLKGSIKEALESILPHKD